MKTSEVIAYEDRLNNLFSQFSLIPVDNDLLQAHWPRYLCVLVSGYLETSVRSILNEYAKEKSAPNIRNYVSKQLEGLQNAKMEKICLLMGSFSTEWEKTLRSETEGELKDAIDSIVVNRHNIAHGRNVGISFGVLDRYYKKSKEVIDLISLICDS